MMFGTYVSPRFSSPIDIFSFESHLVKEPNADIVFSALFSILDLTNCIDRVLLNISSRIQFLDIASPI